VVGASSPQSQMGSMIKEMTVKAELLMHKHIGTHMREMRVGSHVHLTCYIYLSSKTKIGRRDYLLNANCASVKPEGLFTNSLSR